MTRPDLTEAMREQRDKARRERDSSLALEASTQRKLSQMHQKAGQFRQERDALRELYDRQGERLADSATERDAYRAKYEDLEQNRASCCSDMEAECDRWSEREAAVCPEDFSFEEVIGALLKERDSARGARDVAQEQAAADEERLLQLRECIDKHLPHYEPAHEAGDYGEIVRRTKAEMDRLESMGRCDGLLNTMLSEQNKELRAELDKFKTEWRALWSDDADVEWP